MSARGNHFLDGADRYYLAPDGWLMFAPHDGAETCLLNPMNVREFVLWLNSQYQEYEQTRSQGAPAA